MQHTAHHAIKVSLNAWIGAFNTSEWPEGWDMTCPPAAHIGTEYDYEVLAELALESGEPDLMERAELVCLMAQNYIKRLDTEIFDLLMQDDVPVRKAERVTMAELDAALLG